MRIKPLLFLTFIFLIYTGCTSRDYKFVYQNPESSFVNRDDGLILADTTTISYQDMAIQVSLPINAYITQSLFPLQNAAYATSPPISDYTPAEQITDIEVITLNNYNSQFTAAKDISNECQYHSSYFVATDSFTKQELIAQLNDIRNDYYGDFWEAIYISLPTAPTSTSIQRFVINIYTDGGSRLTDTTTNITIKP